MATSATYVSQTKAASIIGVSQPRVAQLIASGNMARYPVAGYVSLDLRDVLRVQRERVHKFIGSQPQPFVPIFSRPQLAKTYDAQDVAKYLGVSVQVARKWIGSKLRITSFEGRTTLTFGAEIERVRAEDCLALWRTYLHRIQYARTRHNFGEYDIENEIAYASSQIQWLEQYIGTLRNIVRLALEENRVVMLDSLSTISAPRTVYTVRDEIPVDEIKRAAQESDTTQERMKGILFEDPDVVAYLKGR